jgi:hypothetical protein
LNIIGLGPAMAGAVAAAAGAFGFGAFLAMAPEVETARIAKPTMMTFFMLAPLVEEKLHLAGDHIIPVAKKCSRSREN